MDTDDSRKKEAKKRKLLEEESERSTKRWLRSDAKKSSDKVSAGAGMTSVGGEKKSKIDKDEKSADEGVKKRKLSTIMKLETSTSPKRLLRSGRSRPDEIEQSEASKVNSGIVEKKTKIDTGNGKKRKLVSAADGSEKPSKRHHPDEIVVKESGELSIFNLPGELLVNIIDMVPICQWASLELVSRSFHGVVNELWGQLHEIRLGEFVFNKEKKPYQVVEAILKKFLILAPNVTSISGFSEIFSESTPIRLSTIQLLAKFQHLESIDFSDGNVVTARNFAAFLESSASRQCWKSLDIVGGIYDINGKMKSRGIVDSRNQPALNLDCFKFNMRTLSIFDRFLQVDWSRLKKLVINDRYTWAKDVLAIIRQCTQVVHLDIAAHFCKNGNGQPWYADFMRGVADLEKLSILKINGHCMIGIDFYAALLVLIQDLGRHRRGITDLALVKCFIDGRILCAIIDHLPHLKSLELDETCNCPSQSLVRLANGMGQLESLKFRSSLGHLLGTIVRAIGDNKSGLSCLHIEYPNCLFEDFTDLGDLRKLKKLRIMVKDIQSGNLERLARLGFGSCLDALELDLRGISPKTMGHFLKNMPRLRSMRLRGVTDDILQVMIEFCPNLVELCIDSSSTITSTGIQSVIDHCSRLKILNVTYYTEWYPSALTVEKYRKIIFKSSNSGANERQ